jgi:hypothetical protein
MVRPSALAAAEDAGDPRDSVEGDRDTTGVVSLRNFERRQQARPTGRRCNHDHGWRSTGALADSGYFGYFG